MRIHGTFKFNATTKQTLSENDQRMTEIEIENILIDYFNKKGMSRYYISTANVEVEEQ